MSEVQLVVPSGIDDPARPSGGNVYDRRIAQGLGELGWAVREHHMVGAWPHPTRAERAALAGVLARMPDEALVLLDGLIGSAVPEVLRVEARRVRLVLLLHMPLDTPDEAGALSGSRAVVATSGWTRDWLLTRDPSLADRIRVVRPGVDPAEQAPGSAAGGQLLCVGAVTRVKGQDVLIEALAMVADLSWRCTCVGALDVDIAFADGVRRRRGEAGLRERVTLTGALGRAELDRAYARADVLVQPSRAETYGMVVTEALARGLPVIAADAGGVAEALGHADDGSRPGLLVPTEDPEGLAHVLRRWMGQPALREQLRVAARSRGGRLTGWDDASRAFAAVLTEVART